MNSSKQIRVKINDHIFILSSPPNNICNFVHGLVQEYNKDHSLLYSGLYAIRTLFAWSIKGLTLSDGKELRLKFSKHGPLELDSYLGIENTLDMDTKRKLSDVCWELMFVTKTPKTISDCKEVPYTDGTVEVIGPKPVPKFFQ